MINKECDVCGKRIGMLTAHYTINSNTEIVCANCAKLLGYNLEKFATNPFMLSKVLNSINIEQLKSGEAHTKIEELLEEATMKKDVKKEEKNQKKQDIKLAKKGTICSKCLSHNVTSLGGIQKGNFGILKVGSSTKAFKMMCNDCGHKWEIKN
ncbi:hypothetical protein [Lactococcus protaetiae]|uniref:DUF4428 domain-containing protein n=1 Tax=Lactococcus protaetiae TaxID=2592653 RepID=A0A514Z6T7_9LACT|nr:hypothetical protein [Lactococcus protaetiae]QDK70319.1 hypothetical protein FLP15_02980 [Lactococcus protaetiae]